MRKSLIIFGYRQNEIISKDPKDYKDLKDFKDFKDLKDLN